MARKKRGKTGPACDFHSEDEYTSMEDNTDSESFSMDCGDSSSEDDDSSLVEESISKHEVRDSKKIHGKGVKKVDKGARQSKHRQPAINSRCSPAKLQCVLHKLLNEEQKKMVVEMGFGGLFDVKIKILHRVVALALIRLVDTEEHVINVHNLEIPIAPGDIGNMFGLSASGDLIPTTISTDERVKLKEFEGISERRLEEIVKEGRTDEKFRRAFILLVFSIFLCPTTQTGPSEKLFGAIVDVRKPKRFNWSQLIFDWLMADIQKLVITLMSFAYL